MSINVKHYAVSIYGSCLQIATFLLQLASTLFVWTIGPLLAKLRSAAGPKAKDDGPHFPEPNIIDDPHTFTLPDGRELGFSNYGIDSNRTFFYLHGFPDSRLGAGIFDEPARKLGLRIIGIDRPGVGLSSPNPGRNYLTDAEDLRLLAKHLELRNYCIIGVSGGGPYALACALTLPPDQLKGIALVCAFGSSEWGIKEKLGNKLLFLGYRYAPWLLRNVIGRLQNKMLSMSDDRLMATMETTNTPSRLRWPKPNVKDAETFHQHKDLFKWLIRGTRTFFQQGFDAFMDECRLLTGVLGFRIEDIREDLPVQLWYGKQDTNVPVEMGEQIAVRMRGKPDFYVEDETHVSMWINQRERILEELARCL